MAETIVVACPECKKQLRVPVEIRGKKVRCKGCSHIFPIPAADDGVKPAPAAKAAPATKPAPAKPKPADDDEFGTANPYAVSHEENAEIPRCPHCAAEMESAEAIICLGCGYNTVTRQRVGTKKTEEITPGDRMTWLMPGLAAVGGILFLFLFDLFFCFVVPRLVKDSDYDWLDYGAFRLWAVIISLFAMFFLGKFAVKRLVLHPTPPEREIG
jgi:hypothetical protein